MVGFIEKMEASRRKSFVASHRIPGIMGLFTQCPNPDVKPHSEAIKPGIKELTDVCDTCGRSLITRALLYT